MKNPDPAFIEKFYQEAISLLRDAREYIANQAGHDMNSLVPGHSLHLSTEVTRVTTRLTEIIAWLLTYKSMASGSYMEIYQPSPRLSNNPLCTEDSVANTSYPLPLELVILLNDTRNLYLRMLRLEEPEE